MNKFVKYLASGIGIAALAASGICYLVWSLHSLHRMIWFGIVFIAGCFIWRYLAGTDYVVYTNPKGKTDYNKIQYREMTKWEQVGVVLKNSVGCAILGALVWTVGYGISCLFGWHPDFWEMHLLYGAGGIAAIVLTFFVVFMVWTFFRDVIYNRDDAREALKSILIWIVVILCSLMVAGVIFYYLFPIAIRS